MILYHGTNIDFQTINLQKCKPYKDFGRGFYMTDIKTQAMEMAARRCKFEMSGTPVLQQYYFDENLLDGKTLSVKVFEDVCNEWAEFIIMNRKAKGKQMHQYDIVIGPVADDGVVLQVNLYLQKIITIDNLLKELSYKKLSRQYLFATERAIKKLERI